MGESDKHPALRIAPDMTIRMSAQTMIAIVGFVAAAAVWATSVQFQLSAINKDLATIQAALGVRDVAGKK